MISILENWVDSEYASDRRCKSSVISEIHGDDISVIILTWSDICIIISALSDIFVIILAWSDISVIIPALSDILLLQLQL